MRKEVPIVLTSLAGLVSVFSVYFFLGKQWGLTDTTDKWAQIIFNFGILVGMINLTRVHGVAVLKRRPNWLLSVFLLVVMWGYAALSTWQTVEGPIAKWIYDGVVVPFDSTMFSLLAFFIASAAYRAFRVRTRDATILLFAAFIVLLGKAPIGDALIPGWGAIPSWGGVADWIMKIPNTAGYRGILLGAFLGLFAICVRILLGLERSYMGGSGGQ